jgi:hypothetical protein
MAGLVGFPAAPGKDAGSAREARGGGSDPAAEFEPALPSATVAAIPAARGGTRLLAFNLPSSQARGATSSRPAGCALRTQVASGAH